MKYANARITLAAFCLLLWSALPLESAHAFVPVIVERGSQDSVSVIHEPALSQAFYGSLEDFPHTYEIKVENELPFFVQIRVPDTDTSSNVLSGILVKQPAKKGRVIEIARLNAKDGAWERVFDMRGGDHYRVGATYEAVLEPGTYTLQVYSSNNREKYVLMVGTEEEMTLGYFEYLARLIEVKRFMDKSGVMIIESPLVYIPLAIILLGALAWYVRKRKRAHENVRYTS